MTANDGRRFVVHPALAPSKLNVLPTSRCYALLLGCRGVTLDTVISVCVDTLVLAAAGTTGTRCGDARNARVGARTAYSPETCFARSAQLSRGLASRFVGGQCAITKSGTVGDGELRDARVILRSVPRVINFHEAWCATSARLGPSFAPCPVGVNYTFFETSTIGDGSADDTSIVLAVVIGIVHFQKTVIASFAHVSPSFATCPLGVHLATSMHCTERDGSNRDNRTCNTAVVFRAIVRGKSLETMLAFTAHLAPGHATCLIGVQRAVPKGLAVVNSDLLDTAVTAGSEVACDFLETFLALGARGRVCDDNVLGVHSAARRLAWAVFDRRAPPSTCWCRI
jgi:hypothetical protein